MFAHHVRNCRWLHSCDYCQISLSRRVYGVEQLGFVALEACSFGSFKLGVAPGPKLAANSSNCSSAIRCKSPNRVASGCALADTRRAGSYTSALAALTSQPPNCLATSTTRPMSSHTDNMTDCLCLSIVCGGAQGAPTSVGVTALWLRPSSYASPVQIPVPRG